MSDSWVQWQHAVARFIYITVTSVKKIVICRNDYNRNWVSSLYTFYQSVKMISQKSIMALNYIYQTGILRTMHGMDFFFAFYFFFSDIQSCINSGFIYLRTSILCLSVCIQWTTEPIKSKFCVTSRDPRMIKNLPPTKFDFQ